MVGTSVLLVMWKPASVSICSIFRFSERVKGPGAPGGGGGSNFPMAPRETAAWQSSLFPQIMVTKRPPGFSTRRVSARALGTLAAYWMELQAVTILKLESGKGRDSISPVRKVTLGMRSRAAMIRGSVPSRPVMDAPEAAARLQKSPDPQPMSSRVSAGERFSLCRIKS